MQKFIVLLLLLDLFSVTLQKSDRKEVTIPVGSPIQLECDADLKVNNIDVTIRRSNTTCFESIPECILPNDVTESIKATCTKQVSCDVDIRNIIKKHSCLQEYGYFNISYSCKMINDLSCDFESNLCNWLPVHDRNRFRWTRGSRGYLPPTVDHTTTSQSGSYVYIYSNYYTSDEGDIAKLESGHIIAHQQCFSFWYFTTNSRDSVHVFQNQNVLLDLSTDKYEKGKWHHIKISLEKTSFYSFQLIFKVRRGIWNYRRPFGAIVIDDILIENTMCNSHFLMCDFESNTCEWNDDNANKDVWKKQNGLAAYPNTSPRTDHTTASGSGYYLFMKSRASVVTTSYFIFQNLDLKLSGNSCFTFWYHMYVYNPYRMEGIHVTIDDKIVWTIVGNQDNKWIKAAIDLDVRKLSIIKFIGFLPRFRGKHIAIDDISLTEGTCAGLINRYEICEDLDDDLSQEIYCPKGYIDLTNYRLSFETDNNECYDQYEKTRMRLLQEWRGGVDSQTFHFNMSTDISSKPECFQLHAFRIQHTCEAEESTTVSQVVIPNRDSGAAEDSTSVSPVVTSIRDSGTDLVVGLVIGGLLLVCVVIVIVVLIKRQSLKSRPRETIKTNSGEYDYIDSHDLAFPLSAIHSSHIPNDGKNSNTASAVRRNTTVSGNSTLSDKTYSIVDQTLESTLNKTRDDGKGTTDSYMVLDPTATGFNRTTLPNTRSDCEFAKPVIVTGNSIGDEDQYALSEEGCYDHSGNNRHKELEVNIYNHAVDTIYDSGSHKRKGEGREDTYDHFLGQITEDGNDI